MMLSDASIVYDSPDLPAYNFATVNLFVTVNVFKYVAVISTHPSSWLRAITV